MAQSIRATLAHRTFRLFAFLGLCALTVVLVGLHWAAVVPGSDDAAALRSERPSLIAPAFAAGNQPPADTGLSLRIDRGTQHLSEHFTKQIAYWGMWPS
jgi:hypothetical protein